MTPTITYRLSEGEGLEPAKIQRLCDLINESFADAETGIMKYGAKRIELDELTIELNTMIFIFAEMEHEIIGTMKVEDFSEGVTLFSMIATDPHYRHLGIATHLVQEAEKWVQDRGYKMVRLQILTPLQGVHEHTEHLLKWYSHLGYSYQSHAPFAWPEMLMVPCDSTIYVKYLQGSSTVSQ